MGYQDRVEAHAAARSGTSAERMAAAQKSGDFPAFITAQREQAEAEAAQAQAAWAASAEGELQAIEEELAIAGAMATPQQWAHLHEGEAVVPPQPIEWQLPLHLRQRVHDERLAQLLKEHTS